MPTRRQFLHRTGSVLAGAALAAGTSRCTTAHESARLRFGVIADVHHGLMPRAEERLDAFLEAAAGRDLDFILQLGDFCFAKPEARPFARRWEQLALPRYHVLGNHDMDFGDKAAIMDQWGMPEPFYSFDSSTGSGGTAGGFHVVVLDANFLHVDGRYIPYADANFYVDSSLRTFISPDQLDWLAADLAATDKPTIVFSHQGLDEVWNGGGVKNRAIVRRIFREAHAEAGSPKVVACFCGHHHVDAHSVIDGVHYVQLNSASYYWVGDDYGRLAKYRDPLFAFVTIEEHRLTIEGRQSVFVEPTPADLGFPNADRLSASISDRVLEV